MARETQFCTFLVGGMLFGLDVACIQEVIRFQPLTVVPRMPGVIAGLINLRGQIVTAVDLRARLGLPPLPAGARPLNVVVRTPEGAVSLLVDEIGDVIVVDDDNFERPPDTLDEAARALIQGAYKLKGCLLLVLDPARAIDSDLTN